MTKVLVAGVGNIFRGDDGFGCEVVRRLAERDLPGGVAVRDFGIRGIDLTYALLDGCDAAVLVDTVQRGGAPGDLYLIEPELPPGVPDPADLIISGHDLDPAKVLRTVHAMGGGCRRLLLVACEPETFGDEMDGAIGLSVPAAAAVDRAMTMVEEAIRQLLELEMVA